MEPKREMNFKSDIENLVYSPNEWENWTAPKSYYVEYNDPYWYIKKQQHVNIIKNAKW